MKIYETAVRKPISTILIFVGVIVFGLFSLNNLAVDQYPDIEIPQIAVITSYAGPMRPISRPISPVCWRTTSIRWRTSRR